MAEAAELSQLQARLSRLSPERRRLIERLTARGVEAQVPEERILPRPEGEPMQVSFAQERIWATHLLAGERPIHNLASGARIRGALDISALERGLETIFRRHEVLRTAFLMALNASPIPAVLPAVDVRLVPHDLSGLEESERQAELQRLIGEEAAAPFDLQRPPLLRTRLIRLTADEHVLLFTMHHIVSDAWSFAVFAVELWVLYTAYSQGEETVLPELPFQYADHASWQRGWLRGDVLDRLLTYWTRQLEDAPAVLDLPLDHPRPRVPAYEGATHHFELSPELTDALRQLARQRGVSLFMVLLAAFDALLYRYTGQADLVVGSPVLGRRRKELEGLIGCFINTVPMRVRVCGAAPFADLLRQVREVVLEAYAHDELPFERLVEAARGSRHRSRAPIFQVLCNLRRDEEQPLMQAGAETLVESLAKLPSPTSQGFDLVLDLVEASDRVKVALEYDTELLEASTVERLAGHLTNLLEAVAADPDRQVDGIPLLSAQERCLHLHDWNRSEASRPAELIPALFAAQAARTPDAEAVALEGLGLTYAELDRRSDRLAAELQRRVVGPEAIVGIHMQQSPEMVIAVLAALKAGGAYLPLDPELPYERLRFMLDEAGPAVVLAQPHLAGAVTGLGSDVLVVDRVSSGDAGAATHPRPPDIFPDSPAYVIYTSGSTGRPKGVVVTHGGIRNRVLWTIERHGLGPGDRLLQKTAFSFDAAVWEFLAPLLSGGTVVLARAGGHRDAAYLARTLAEERITVLQMVPSMLRLLVEEPGLERCQTLRLLFSAGEQLTPRLRERCLARLPADLYNTYGPTECSIDATAWRCSSEDGEAAVPIGMPIDNARVYVVGPSLEPVPVGVLGEIYVAGEGLARGYLSNPGLTAERFVPDPFGEPGSRAYRTGDLGRRRPDGALEFARRVDHQVKLRGYRIELGEIEAALGDVGGIREAAVVLRQDQPDLERLAGYLVADGPGKDAEAVRSELAGRLPDYMVPAELVWLERLPLLPNGKLDRAALPAPPRTANRTSSELVEPGDPLERSIAGIWVELLSVERVGLTDNFFNLGGHSLAAVQLIARLREACGVELPLPKLFEDPTLAGLVANVRTAMGSSPGQPAQPAVTAPPITPISREVPLSFTQERLIFLDQWLAGEPLYNLPAPLKLTGPLQVPILERCLNEIVRRHDVLRASFPQVDGRVAQVLRPTLPLRLPVEDLSRLEAAGQDAGARAWIEADWRRPFDLADGPLVRAGLVRLAPDEHLLLVVMHHTVCDGWSMQVLTRELCTLYPAFVAREPSSLPELPIQYSDFAAWQRRWLDGETTRERLAYWRAQLAGAPPVLELPADFPRPAVQSFRAGHVQFALSPQCTEALRALSGREGVTTFMTLLAAFQALLLGYTGQADMVLGSPVAGRDRREVEPLIGPFINTLVLRTDLSGDPTFRELLARVRDVALGAYAHQDLPFERLVEELQPERDLSRTPLFQVMFAFQNAGVDEIEAGPIRVRPLLMEDWPNRCDLTVTVVDTGPSIWGSFEYSAELFEPGSIQRMTEHFQRMLENLDGGAGRRLSELRTMGWPEGRRLLETSSGTLAAPLERGLTHERFAAQARLTPDAVAVKHGAHALTYAELEQRAAQLAEELAETGAGPERVVAIHLERSPEALIAILAVLKAGAAYLPIDAGLPSERIAFMLRDAHATVVLTSARLGQKLPPSAAGVLILDAERVRPQARTRPAPSAEPENLAYVIYTSGSTGSPKGVMVTHGGLANYVDWCLQAYPVRDGCGSPLHSPLGFDLSVTSFFPALAAGGRVDTLDEAPGVERLAEALRSGGYSLVKLTPAHLQLLSQELSQEEASRCSAAFVIGGESLSAETVEFWLQAAPGVELINEYGPTETVVGAVAHWVSPESLGGVSVPIGRPIQNTRAYVLDANLEPVPPGVVGELFIGGAGVARGYVGRPDLTAASFVPDPWSAEPGARMYRTGDLAKGRSDAALVFLGRRDQQVKVRGYRVELEEVETALRQHPAVRDAAVLATGETAATRRLEAFLVSDMGSLPALAELRQFVGERLPDFMVPATFGFVPQLPLTGNGKVDRAALSRLEGVAPSSGFVAPRGPIQEVLAAVWAEVLERDEIGVEDGFFDFGGHSLLAMQLVSRTNEIFESELVLRDLFQNPTVAQLAAVLEAGHSDPARLSRIAELVRQLEVGGEAGS